MGYFYFARHGQTFWNVENKICGATDIGLTEKGILQAEELAAKMLEENVHIDQIICSPLIRAAKTAEIVSKRTGIPWKADERLKEQCFGKWEGTHRKGEDFAEAKTHFIDSYEGGETMLKLAHRIYTVLDEITSQDDTVYLIVAHNGISRVVESYFRDMENAEFGAFGIRNCELVRYDYGKQD